MHTLDCNRLAAERDLPIIRALSREYGLHKQSSVIPKQSNVTPKQSNVIPKHLSSLAFASGRFAALGGIYTIGCLALKGRGDRRVV